MPDVNILVDGVPVTVPAGTNVVDAARVAQVAVPVFCYHPRMKPVGMCRMCLVEVWTPKIDPATRQPVLDEQGKPVMAMMMGKLQTGCTTPVSEGMEIRTQTEQVKFAQKGVLEFLLTSHPLDCPVCDKGGECPLQNLTMQWGPGLSRFDYSDKIHFEKPVPLGDLIYLDRERCILCGRCVRFQDEIADDPVLGFDSRGRSWQIISKSDPPFDSKFSGNTTDICPVGALTSSDFRFKARVWEVQPQPSVCTHCPVGCNITLDMRHNQLKRVMPRENSAVNDIWICDKGRFGMRFIESAERLTTPLVRRGGTLQPATWDEALDAVAERLSAIQRATGGDGLAGLAGERLANEDLFLFQKFCREVLGTNHLDHRVGAPGEAADDDLSAELGVGVGTDLTTLGKGTTVLVLGADPEEEAPLYMVRLRGIAQRGGELLVANARPTKLDRSATKRLRYTAGSEVTLVQGLLKLVLDEVGGERLSGRVAGLEELRSALAKVSLAEVAAATGLPEETLLATAKSFAQAENGIIMYGADALALGPALSHGLGSLALLAGKVGKANNGLIGLLPRGNSRGALDMGVRPDCRPGYAPLAQPGLSAREMWGAIGEKRLRGMYIVGLDPARDYPATAAAL
nr:molybdopterin-dependent oxidoreductase [Chloroflexaceae bacterium]